ncbi:hypothetical protein MPTK1_5g22040 [Marchantia polymorpha subsp. ruderalis]|uniref:Uncharacterized protein n=2 Tax=Marchantia polymorpha TaxID=3197 RepID=A0AAF6BKZ7_MARPO|nr:hypothetical protein MARPO_0194s0005 [Marchantia polymorpha]PTQ27526.1 hypothetical protein MARPO_0194s0005 [Marchantia polymorpha]BBN12680.1 hypothetical protein Mp_5g22040 [Marchantia polymorpha subsp. ruderalis]BBN12681.1 hypothetical protein Mp_5g22040 [Marchantia polymorpha subsp. ruderalis]|eukprot:PTQ27525.1 hypothetical protein MARPO_0194s0005 [Marchantia polymorpha]
MHFPIGSEIENGLQAMFDTVVVLMSLTTIMIAVWYILWGCQDFSKNPESMCTKKGMPTKQATSAMSKPHSVIDIAAVEGQKGDCEAKGHVPYVFTSIEDFLRVDHDGKDFKIHEGDKQVPILVDMDTEEKRCRDREKRVHFEHSAK